MKSGSDTSVLSSTRLGAQEIHPPGRPAHLGHLTIPHHTI
jgi:hypothetical protein